MLIFGETTPSINLFIAKSDESKAFAKPRCKNVQALSAYRIRRDLVVVGNLKRRNTNKNFCTQRQIFSNFSYMYSTEKYAKKRRTRLFQDRRKTIDFNRNTVCGFGGE